jgi:hypothetical protein
MISPRVGGLAVQQDLIILRGVETRAQMVLQYSVELCNLVHDVPGRFIVAH